MKTFAELGFPGRMIAVILENGETLTGAIVWAKGERTGIALDQPLADDHELLAGTHRC